MALPARADRLDDDLNTVWEATWDQRGTPSRLIRWQQPIRYRFVDERETRQRETVVAALTSAAEAAGVAIGPAGASDSVGSQANLDIEFVDEHSMGESVSCVVNHRSRAFAITSARLKLRPSEAWSCAHHEAMHVMGVLGHPSGRTVLSYFPWRRDVLLPLDRLMLSAWYDPALRPGATPFELLWAAGLRVAQQADLDVDRVRAHERRQTHYTERVREMESFARGEADVPTIVKRSGRANPGHIEEARGLMAYYLGLAHQRSIGMSRDDAQAVAWFGEAARRAHHPSQVLLARALISGTGIAADAVEAHRWLARAAQAGNTAAPGELQSLEKSMDAVTLERARALGPH